MRKSNDVTEILQPLLVFEASESITTKYLVLASSVAFESASNVLTPIASGARPREWALSCGRPPAVLLKILTLNPAPDWVCETMSFTDVSA